MKTLDYVLRDWRYRMAEPYVPDGARVLDVGGFDGSFLSRIEPRIRSGVCLDPLIDERTAGVISFVRARQEALLPFPDASFDVVVMLAVFEHLSSFREAMVAEVYRVLSARGIVVLTVPSGAVDHLLKVMVGLRLVDGMSLEEHDHFAPGDTVPAFTGRGFRLVRHRKFQLGLNNLFVFQKQADS